MKTRDQTGQRNGQSMVSNKMIYMRKTDPLKLFYKKSKNIPIAPITNIKTHKVQPSQKGVRLTKQGWIDYFKCKCGSEGQQLYHATKSGNGNETEINALNTKPISALHAKICTQNLTDFYPDGLNSTPIIASIFLRIHLANPLP